MLLHNEQVRVGDIVFDVSATRGTGRVVNITAKGAEVQFGNGGPRFIYKTDGAQLGRSRPTLFWHDPIFVAPMRNETLWKQQKDMALAMRKVLEGALK